MKKCEEVQKNIPKSQNDTKKEEKPQKIDEQQLAQLQSSIKTIDNLSKYFT